MRLRKLISTPSAEVRSDRPDPPRRAQSRPDLSDPADTRAARTTLLLTSNAWLGSPDPTQSGHSDVLKSLQDVCGSVESFPSQNCFHFGCQTHICKRRRSTSRKDFMGLSRRVEQRAHEGNTKTSSGDVENFVNCWPFKQQGCLSLGDQGMIHLQANHSFWI